MNSRRRVDQALVERGLAETRARAQAMVMAGLVFSGDRRLDKPGATIAADAPLRVKGRDHPWVSRGGVKLAHAIEHFGVSVARRIALDIGASTGGFTDVLLHHGAAKVYAVDVGHAQLAWSLRSDSRVVALDRTNARYLSRQEIPEAVDVIVCDASFIGLETILPAALALAASGADLIALIKPQFEVGPSGVGKGGVVRDPALRRAACERIARWLDAQDWTVRGTIESPIRGAGGNVEFLVAAQRR